MASQVNFMKHSKKINTYTSQIFQKIEEVGMLSNSFYKASITLIPKPNKDCTKSKHRAISLMNIDAKIFNEVFAN